MPQAKANGKRVLVVEDNRFIRELLTELLEYDGFAVSAAEHGGQGLAALADGEFACILLDWIMPVVSGREFRQVQLRHARWTHTPTVVLTGDIFGASQVAEVRGATLVQKPLDVHKLLELVRASSGM